MTQVVTNYLVTYDALQSLQFSNKLLAYVRENGKVLAWMRPFEGAYLLKSYHDLSSIQQSFFAFFEGSITFFVQPVYPHQMHGSASPNVWEWINKNSVPEILALQGN